MGLQSITKAKSVPVHTITSHLQVLTFLLILDLFKLIILTETPQLLDTRCIDGRTSDNTTSDAYTTESCAGFRDQLKDRDGSCIITNASASMCDGVHYYAHSKGSQVGLVVWLHQKLSDIHHST